MVKFRRYAVAMALLATSGMLLPTPPVTAAPQRAQQVRQGTDISMEGGILRGRFLDANGSAIAGVTVTVSRNGKPVAQTTTLSDGSYRISGLSTGQHTVTLADHQFPVRLWSKSTAPASAKSQLTVAQTAVRGQFVDEFGNPIWATVGIGVVAVAALTVAIISVSKFDDLEDEVDDLTSP